MIQGFLRIVDRSLWPEDYLCFKCPHCGLIHCIYVNPEKTYIVQGAHVWQYTKISDTVIRIAPSFDASQYCGYHGPNPWEVELTLPEEEAKKGMIGESS